MEPAAAVVRDQRKLVQQMLTKTKCRRKLVEISAEEKKSVEMQECTGYQFGR